MRTEGTKQWLVTELLGAVVLLIAYPVHIFLPCNVESQDCDVVSPRCDVVAPRCHDVAPRCHVVIPPLVEMGQREHSRGCNAVQCAFVTPACSDPLSCLVCSRQYIFSLTSRSRVALGSLYSAQTFGLFLFVRLSGLFSHNSGMAEALSEGVQHYSNRNRLEPDTSRKGNNTQQTETRR